MQSLLLPTPPPLLAVEVQSAQPQSRPVSWGLRVAHVAACDVQDPQLPVTAAECALDLRRGPDPDASEDAETVRESNVGGVIWMGRGTDCVLTNL